MHGRAAPVADRVLAVRTAIPPTRGGRVPRRLAGHRAVYGGPRGTPALLEFMEGSSPRLAHLGAGRRDARRVQRARRTALVGRQPRVPVGVAPELHVLGNSPTRVLLRCLCSRRRRLASLLWRTCSASGCGSRAVWYLVDERGECRRADNRW